MSKKSDFITIVQKEIFDRPDIWLENYPDTWDNAAKFWELFKQGENIEKPLFTENGKIILKHMQDNLNIETWNAKSLADGIGFSAKSITGGMRKLINEGFVEKLGTNPTTYEISEKGKEIKIN